MTVRYSPIPTEGGKSDPINYQAWARNAVAFIREKGLEAEFTDWCGGWPSPVKGTGAMIAAAPALLDWSDFEDEIAEAIQDSLDADWTARDGARAVVRFLNELAGRKALEAGRGG
jgi:hypothetical protein